MRGALLLPFALLCACPAPPVEDAGVDAGVDAGSDGPWRSALYPDDWTPAFTDSQGRFLHDFSYAGYRNGETPPTPQGFTVAVVPDGGDDTAALQAAIDAVQAADGGVVLLGPYDYRVDGVLRVTGSNVVIRGEGPETTRIVFRKSLSLSNDEHLRFGGTQQLAGEWPLAEDGVTRAFTVKLGAGDGGVLAVGDDVVLGFTITPEFTDAYGMTGVWRPFAGTWQPMLWRRVEAVASDGTVTLDVPLRLALLERDGASLKRVVGTVKEVGLEGVGVSNAIDPGQAWQMTQVHVVAFRGVADAWMRGVASFSFDGGAHVQSGGVMVLASKRVTVSDTHFGRAQHRAGGGNGYLFEVRQSSEVLFADDTGTDGRHNFIQNWGFGATGIVWLRVHSQGGFMEVSPGSTQGGVGYSEFHHSLATANLIDSSDFDDGFSIMNRGLESSGAGHTGTESVFWNVGGKGLLRSMQYGNGFLIGTRGIDLGTYSDFSIYAGTAPEDFVEGVDGGARLVPPSLYEDQRRRRLGP